MKIIPHILILFLLAFSVLSKAQHVPDYRTKINAAEQSAEEAKKFLKKMELSYSKTKQPIFLALSGIGNFFQAKHSYNPVSKLSYFNRGKKMLQTAVKQDPNNLEIRFLRYISQKKIPKILGYHDHIEEDEKFLREHHSKTNDAALKKEILRHLNSKN